MRYPESHSVEPERREIGRVYPERCGICALASRNLPQHATELKKIEEGNGAQIRRAE